VQLATIAMDVGQGQIHLRIDLDRRSEQAGELIHDVPDDVVEVDTTAWLDAALRRAAED